LQFRNFSNVPPLDAIMSVASVPDTHYVTPVAALQQSYMTNHGSVPTAGRVLVAGSQLPPGTITSNHGGVLSLHHVN